MLVFLPFGLINLIIQGVVLRGHPGMAGLMMFGLYLLILYMLGIAIFRALRYRLSRTFWHGIRGGSDDQGLGYGGQYLWRTVVGSLALGLLIPWSMTSLWNERWNKMSFGPMRFTSAARSGPLMLRFLLFYLVPIFLFVAVVIGAGTLVGLGATMSAMPGQATILLIGFVFVFMFYGVLGVIALIFYSAYFKEVIGNLTLGELEFGFTATTMDWIKLMLGSLALIFLTFGIGYIFVAYRNWAFFIRHLQAFGDVRLDQLTQSKTREARQGEGLLDAFDVGAF